MKDLKDYLIEGINPINEATGDPILDNVKKYIKYIQTRRDTWERVVELSDFDAMYNLKGDIEFWSGKGKIANLKKGQKLKGPFINFRLEDDEDPKMTIYLDNEFEFEGWDSNGIEFGQIYGDNNGTVGPVFIARNEREVWEDTVFAVELTKPYAQKIFNLIK